jgi:hypothetical protein
MAADFAPQKVGQALLHALREIDGTQHLVFFAQEMPRQILGPQQFGQALWRHGV